MFGNKKKQPNPLDADAFINKLNLSQPVKSAVREAFYRQVGDSYSKDQEGFTQKHKDLELIRDASTMGLESLRDKSSIKSVGDYSMISGPSGVNGGYAPAGSILRRLYPNEFTLHSFLCEAYWASVKSRRELWVEGHRDGYSLIASSSVPKKTIKLINNVLVDLKVPYYRNKLRDILLVMGNVVMDNEVNNKGGLLELKPLLMERVKPRYNDRAELLGWEYNEGAGSGWFYPYNPKNHITTYNMRNNVVGAPACNSIIVDQEAALQAAIYNNNLMQRGGLLSVLIRLRDPKNAGFINDKVTLNLAEEFTKWLNRSFGGIKGGGGMAFVPMVEGVDVLNKISEMDNAWQGSDNTTARKTALLYGIYPERIGIPSPNNSQYKNSNLVSDTISLSFDNNNFYFQSLVDEYLTRTIIKEGLGVDNVSIEATGSFSAISMLGANFAAQIAQGGADIMDVNTFRVDVLHIDPLPGPEGDKYLGEFFRRVVEGQAPQSKLNQILGPGKVLFNDYKEVAANKCRYRSNVIPFLDD